MVAESCEESYYILLKKQNLSNDCNVWCDRYYYLRKMYFMESDKTQWICRWIFQDTVFRDQNTNEHNKIKELGQSNFQSFKKTKLSISFSSQILQTQSTDFEIWLRESKWTQKSNDREKGWTWETARLDWNSRKG